jgi:hypothetical protein
MEFDGAGGFLARRMPIGEADQGRSEWVDLFHIQIT